MSPGSHFNSNLPEASRPSIFRRFLSRRKPHQKPQATAPESASDPSTPSAVAARLPVAPIPASTPQADADASGELRVALLGTAALATALWRIQVKLTRNPALELPPPLRHLRRHFQAAWDALAECGIEVKDPVGEPFSPGLQHMRVIAFEAKPGMEKERIDETVKPAVYYRGKLIQHAEVIVARPVDEGTGTEAGPQEPTPAVEAGEPKSSAAAPSSAVADQAGDATKGEKREPNDH
jgi:hypothetical protein